jgi:hypothetical protein
MVRSRRAARHTDELGDVHGGAQLFESRNRFFLSGHLISSFAG